MDVYISEMTSTVQAADSDALLSPQILRLIVQAVLDELRQQEAYEARRLDERRIQSGAYSRMDTWE